jgi:predicted  nucleic acid-binding Zn-ribbon protein
LSEEVRRTAAADAWLVEARQRVASLSGKIVDLRIRHEDAVADAKEAREKLSSLIEHARKD